MNDALSRKERKEIRQRVYNLTRPLSLSASTISVSSRRHLGKVKNSLVFTLARPSSEQRLLIALHDGATSIWKSKPNDDKKCRESGPKQIERQRMEWTERKKDWWDGNGEGGTWVADKGDNVWVGLGVGIVGFVSLSQCWSRTCECK